MTSACTNSILLYCSNRFGQRRIMANFELEANGHHVTTFKAINTNQFWSGVRKNTPPGAKNVQIFHGNTLVAQGLSLRVSERQFREILVS
ncbi:hypothetical protein TM7_0638 [candidate division TM7 genomosp. GTL1]|nr:hypothetical protein TM7_0638 [candidate division TM7 genomosp. GTL1]